MVRVHNNNAAVMLTGWRNPRRGPGAFVAMTRERADAVIQLPSPMLYGEHKRIVELAAKSRLPAMYAAREFVEDWGPDVLRGELA